MGTLIAVVGTDTGVGKTYVSRGLCRLLCNAGRDVLPLKLVETGCPKDESGALASLDGLALARAARCSERIESVAPYRFALPASPWIAARAEGVSLDPKELRERVIESVESTEYLVLEGAGGVLVPWTESLLFADFLRELPLAGVIVVARDRLGTVNHTLLTLEALKQRSVRVLAVVTNASSEEAFVDAPKSVESLKRWIAPTELFGPLHWSESGDDGAAGALEESGMSVRWIEQRL